MTATPVTPRRRPRLAARLLLAAIVVMGGSQAVGALTASEPDRVEPISTRAAPAGALTTGDGLGAAVGDRRPLAERLAFWAARVEARPDDFLSLTQLALAEAEAARMSADLAGYARAAALVDRALKVVPAYPPTIAVRGAIRFALHDFSGARADAQTVLASLPDDVTALALLGDASLELGALATADDAYARLARLAPGPWLDVRLARSASLRGDHAGALALARRASGAAASLDPAEAPTYAFAVGEYARLAGDATVARIAFEGVLRARSADLGALVGLARIDAFEGDIDAALAGLRRAAAIAPEPATLALLGDLLAASGDDAGAKTHFETVRLIARLGELDGAVHDRAILRFELDHGGASEVALAAAQASVAARPDAAGHDLVAWALYRLGRHDAATAAIAAARAIGSDDARLRFHEGAITVARGDRAAGEALLRSALALGPALDPTERAEAVRLLAGPS